MAILLILIYHLLLTWIRLIQEMHGLSDNVKKDIRETQKIVDKETDTVKNEIHCDQSKNQEYRSKEQLTKDNIDKPGEKGDGFEKKIPDNQTKGAIPKTTSNSIKTRMPDESHYEQTQENAQNEGESLSVAIEITDIPEGTKNTGNRVPYISDPNGHIGKKSGTINLRSMFTEDKSFDDKSDNPMTDDYKLYCIKQFSQSEKGFVTIEPGVFALALEVSYEDDYRIIKTVYPTLRYDSDTCQVEGKVYLLEKKVFQHLDNFHTELICSIFEALSKDKNANSGYITEFDYLILMKQRFNYSLSTIYGDLENYSAKETKSKFCPGRNSRIEKLFQKQTFK